MKVYLDNNVVSALGKNDTPAKSNALSAMLEAFETGKCDVCTSQVTGDEIKKYQGNSKLPIEAIYRLLKKVPYVESQKLLGFNTVGDSHSWITSPMIEDDPIWSKLRSLGIDNEDSHHLMLAVRAGCDVFLSCDGGLLNKAAQIEQGFRIRVLKPSQVVAEINRS